MAYCKYENSKSGRKFINKRIYTGHHLHYNVWRDSIVVVVLASNKPTL